MTADAPLTEQLRDVRRALYARRNGIVADTLRRAGAPFRLIYGVNLPQLAEVAAGVEKSGALAEALWADRHHREAMLLATMVYPAGELTEERAADMTREAPWPETADLLTMKLLRLTPFARRLAERLAASPLPMQRYCALRLMYFRLPADAPAALAAARAELERADSLTAPIARRLLEEAELAAENS